MVTSDCKYIVNQNYLVPLIPFIYSWIEIPLACRVSVYYWTVAHLSVAPRSSLTNEGPANEQKGLEGRTKKAVDGPLNKVRTKLA